MGADAELQRKAGRMQAGSSGRPIRFVAEVEAQPLAVRMLLYALLKRLERHIGPADAGSIELVLAEILNNIVEHAYGEGRSGALEVVAELRPAALDCRVRDWGNPLPGHAIPLSGLPSTAVAIGDLPEGGWGWALIREVARDLRYGREGDCNVLHLAIPLGFD